MSAIVKSKYNMKENIGVKQREIETAYKC